MATYLMVLNDRPIIHWLVSEKRAPFSWLRRRVSLVLREGDSLLLYTTRGAWHNGVRDRGRVVGEARLGSPLEKLEDPVRIDIQNYELVADLEPVGLAPVREGVDLGLVAETMNAFVETPWEVALRAPVVRLDAHDARLLRTPLRRLMLPWDEAAPAYLELAAP